MATIGFIGLGIMGAHMARNLIKGGHKLVVNGKYPVPDDIRAQTQVVADSTAVAQESEIVITMVPDTPDVANVLFADDGVAKGLTKGKLVIDMSSIAPLDTQEFAKKINALGCDYLDAPVSGGLQMSSHRAPHDAEADESDLAHRFVPSRCPSLMGPPLTIRGTA